MRVAIVRTTLPVTGSHQAFTDVETFLSCTSEKYVFCRTKQLANDDHLLKKHLKKAIYIVDQTTGIKTHDYIEVNKSSI